MYLNEVSPIALRGMSGTLNQLTVVTALAIAQVVGLPQILGETDYFYYILGEWGDWPWSQAINVSTGYWQSEICKYLF